MTVKRRVVWFSDPEWDELQRNAAVDGVTISAYLRSLGWSKVVGTPGHAIQTKSDNPALPAHHMTQGERDAILRKVNKGKP